ncbi:MAG: lamin tail domain-containing protein, partial [Myxococcales bacterium]|nr:lamin tail domain-containing protein [Myxococcales bacterium]
MGGMPPVGRAPAPGDLVITEILYDPHNALAEDTAEWFEIENRTGDTLNLAGCVFADDGGNETAADGIILEPFAIGVVARSADGLLNGGLPNVVGTFDFGLNNGGDSVIVRCGDVEIDVVAYDDGAAAFPDARQYSISLDPEAEDNADGANWCLAGEDDVYYEGATPDDVHRGTPGAANPACPEPIAVTACRILGDAQRTVNFRTTFDVSGLIEIPGVTDLTNGVDVDNRVMAQVGVAPRGTVEDDEAWIFTPAEPDGAWDAEAAGEVGRDAYIVTLDAPRVGEYDVAFRASADGGLTWTWCDTDADLDGYQPESALQLTVDPDPADVCDPECGADEVCLRGTCVAAAPAAPGDVIVTEILYDPHDPLDDNDAEWFELTNLTDSNISLLDCFVADDGGNQVFVDDVIEAGGTLLFVRSDDGALNGGLEPDLTFGFSLGNGGDSLTVQCGETVLDTVVYDDVDGWPGATQRISIQLSADRYDAEANDAAGSWCVAPEELVYFVADPVENSHRGTPGAANAQCPVDPCDPNPCDENQICDAGECIDRMGPGVGEVFFTEVLMDPHTSLDDTNAEWFELHNPTDGALDLTGCTITENGGMGIELTHMIEAGGYLLFVKSEDMLLNGGLVPDGTFGFGLGNSAESLTLSCFDVVIDTIAWGTGTDLPSVRQASLQLDPRTYTAELNDLATSWCSAEDVYYEAGGDGDHRGTPGAANPQCADPCFGVVCDEGLECVEGACVMIDPCADVVCDDPQMCVDGECVDPDPCLDVICDGDDVCVDGECVAPDPCADVVCDDPLVCVEGECVAPVPTPTMVGDVLITELLYDPHDGLPEETAEWFELHNPGEVELSLEGCVAREDNNQSSPLNGVVPAGGYVFFARSADPGVNGGLTPTGTFNFSLGNSGETLTVACNGVDIDAVTYDDGPDFPDARKVSINLDPDAFDEEANDEGSNWCFGRDRYFEAADPVGDHFGTPGAPNVVCAFTDAQMQALVDDRCAGCHTNGGMSGTMTLDDIFVGAVGVPSFEAEGLDRIEPGDHMASYLWHKLNGTHLDVGGEGLRMPRSGPPYLTDAQIERVGLWIDGLPVEP